MANPRVPVVRGARQAMQAFRYEVARELGMHVPAESHKTLPTAAIQGDIPQRMVALAEQQMGTDGP